MYQLLKPGVSSINQRIPIRKPPSKIHREVFRYLRMRLSRPLAMRPKPIVRSGCRCWRCNRGAVDGLDDRSLKCLYSTNKCHEYLVEIVGQDCLHHLYVNRPFDMICICRHKKRVLFPLADSERFGSPAWHVRTWCTSSLSLAWAWIAGEAPRWASCWCERLLGLPNLSIPWVWPRPSSHHQDYCMFSEDSGH